MWADRAGALPFTPPHCALQAAHSITDHPGCEDRPMSTVLSQRVSRLVHVNGHFQGCHQSQLRGCVHASCCLFCRCLWALSTRTATPWCSLKCTTSRAKLCMLACTRKGSSGGQGWEGQACMLRGHGPCRGGLREGAEEQACGFGALQREPKGRLRGDGSCRSGLRGGGNAGMLHVGS